MMSNSDLTPEQLQAAAEAAWENQSYFRFPYLKVRQPLGEFYIISIASADLLSLAHNDIRKMSTDVDDYMGLQRRLNDQRVKQLQDYVARVDAVFPTAVIVHLKEEFVRIDETHRHIDVVKVAGVAQVLDGQHRLAGLGGFGHHFELNAVVFVGLDLEDQANIFATINIEQTKVNKSLVYDLYAFAQSRSPQRTAHKVVVRLNRSRDSALQGRIKRLGFAEGDASRTVTQAVLVEGMVRHMSRNPGLDRDMLKRGKRVLDLPQDSDLVLRSIWLKDPSDEEIYVVLRDYFNAAAERWPDAWEGLRGYMLCRTNGIKALLRALPSAMGEMGKADSRLEEKFRNFFDRIQLKDGDFNSGEFPPGTGGESKLFKVLVGQS